jgi:hypothetical protein
VVLLSVVSLVLAALLNVVSVWLAALLVVTCAARVVLWNVV